MRLRPELRDPSTVATVLAFAGMVTGTQGEWNRATALYEEGLALYREVGSPEAYSRASSPSVSSR